MQRLEACICDIDIWMVKKHTKTKWGEDRGPLHIQGWIFVQIFSETIANWWNRHSSSRECEESWNNTGQLSDLNKHVSAGLLLCTSETLERFVIF